MAEHNPIIARLKGERKQISRMITPWQRGFLSGRTASVDSGPAAELAPAAKKKWAVMKMRAIRPETLGNLQPEAIKQMAGKFVEKSRELQQLIHVNPKMTRESKLWTKMDQVLPTAATSEQEPPTESGILKQGSIIPKMTKPSPFPKEGQSFAEFKSQMQSSETMRPKPKAQPDKKPQYSPNSRLFARVQEFSNKEEQKQENETGFDEGNLPQTLPGITPRTEIIQREVDDSQIPVSTLKPVESTPKPNIKTPDSEMGRMELPLTQSKKEIKDQVPNEKAAKQSFQTLPDLKQTVSNSDTLPSSVPLSPKQPVGEKVTSPQKTVTYSRPAQSTDQNLSQGWREALPQAHPVFEKKETLQKAKAVPFKKSDRSETILKTSAKLTTPSEGNKKPGGLPVNKPGGQMVVQREPEPTLPHEVSGQVIDENKPQATMLPSFKMDTDESTPLVKNENQHFQSDKLKMPLEMTLQKKLAIKRDAPLHFNRSEKKQIRETLKPSLHIKRSDVKQIREALKPPMTLTTPQPDLTQKKPSIDTTRSALPSLPKADNIPVSGRLSSSQPPLMQDQVVFSPQMRPLALPTLPLPLPGRLSSSQPPLMQDQVVFSPQMGPLALPALPLPLPLPGVPSDAMQFRAPALDMPHARPVFRGALPGQASSSQSKNAQQAAGKIQSSNVNTLGTDSEHTQTSQDASQVQQNKAPTQAGISSTSSGGQVVQRMFQDPVEDLKTASNHVMGKAGLGGKSSGGQGSSGGDIQKLAEDILPLVKRLLETERDRTSGYSR